MPESSAPSRATGFDDTQQQRQGVVTQSLADEAAAAAPVVPGVKVRRSAPLLGTPEQFATRHTAGPPPVQESATDSEAKPSASRALIAASLAALLIGGGIGAYYFMGAGSPEPDKSQQQAGQTSPGGGPGAKKPPPPPNQPPARAGRAELVEIPGGTFQMGRNGGTVAEGPPREVTVKPFAIDKTEVTNAEYAEFVRETKHAAPAGWVDAKPLPGQERWPVTNVSIADAEAFAAWRSRRDGAAYRLPTEEEWEYAARGGDRNNLYPWGDTWEAGRAATKESGAHTPQPVGSFTSGASRWGVQDMIGNVWEWTSSKAAYYPGGTARVPAEQRSWAVARGGSFLAESKGERAISATYRDWFQPTTRNPYIGFRLVRTGI